MKTDTRWPPREADDAHRLADGTGHRLDDGTPHGDAMEAPAAPAEGTVAPEDLPAAASPSWPPQDAPADLDAPAPAPDARAVDAHAPTLPPPTRRRVRVSPMPLRALGDLTVPGAVLPALLGADHGCIALIFACPQCGEPSLLHLDARGPEGHRWTVVEGTPMRPEGLTLSPGIEHAAERGGCGWRGVLLRGEFVPW